LGKKPGKEKSMAEQMITFMVGVPTEKKLEIAVGTYEYEQLSKEYNKAFREFCSMAAWFNDPKTEPAGKTQFIPTLKNMIETIYLMTKMMDCIGAPDKVMAENLSLPF
jgi:hypothetical protein